MDGGGRTRSTPKARGARATSSATSPAAATWRWPRARRASAGVGFDPLAGLFDKAILDVENSAEAAGRFEDHMRGGAAREPGDRRGALADARSIASRAVPLEQVGSASAPATAGSGCRSRKGQIRSEILCHGLGAHAMFPQTRTVLDIGGQDTKAIQVDEHGIVTSFQMNDRCAAGCGRYLGYIADEMNLGVHELGPLACQSTAPVRINSTCTVFAGAELRERLSLGEKREDILAGLHRAIILRAMSLLARSGGVTNEFTFTGGVARNPGGGGRACGSCSARTTARSTINISDDSIYTGALGAALFALRERRGRRRAATATGAGHGHTTSMLTAGIDVGSAAIKIAVVETRRRRRRASARRPRRAHPAARSHGGGRRPVRRSSCESRRRARATLGYVATTGEGEAIPFRTGHFYGMTTHARGGLFLEPDGARGHRHRRAAHARRRAWTIAARCSATA